MEGERTASAADSTEPEPARPAAASQPTCYLPGPLDPTAENETVAGRVVHAAGAQPLAVIDSDRYELAGEHARGGLGRVLRARDRRLGRPVAVKELLRDSDEASARFVREAEITARLQHPGVVPIYEAGRWPNGKPFYAMRMVAGRPLSEVIAACRDVGERMALLPNVIAIAETMAYAHGQRVLHRDLKPSNVLVGDYGETVVIDWGLAKDLDQPASGADLLLRGTRGADGGMTVVGTVLGTPAYMPPEQARGEAVDARADVYALGAILYHLLGGAPPYRGVTGDVIAAVAAGPPPPLSRATPGLPPDLLTIVDKAMARDATARYPSAAEFAADLKRFTTGQLVSAHRYTAGTLVRRWLSRHRAIVAVATAALVTMSIAGTIAVINIIASRDDARVQGRLATTRADELGAQRNQLILQQATSALDRDATEALTWLLRYPTDGADWPQVRSIAADAVSRGVARHVLGEQAGEVYSASLSADGSRIATGSSGQIYVWDAQSGAVVGSYPHPEGRWVAISADGRMVVSAGGSTDYDLRLWRTDQATPSLLRGHTAVVRSLALSYDDRNILTSSKDGTLRWWDVASGTSIVLRGDDSPLVTAALFSDGRRAAALAADGGLWLWDLSARTGRPLGRVDGDAQAIAVAPDGRRIAAAIGSGVWLWSVDGGEGHLLGRHDGIVTDVAFVDDMVVSGSSDRSVRVWPIDGAQPSSLLGHEQGVNAVAVSPAGWIASGDETGDVRLWRRIADGTEYEWIRLRGHRMAITSLVFSADGRRLVSSSQDLTSRVWDVGPPASRAMRGSSADLFQLSYAADGRALVTTSYDGTVRLWNLEGASSVVLGTYARPAYGVAVTADGRSAVSGAWDGSVDWWDLGQRLGRSLRGSGARVWGVACSPNGQWVAVADLDGVHLVSSTDGNGSVLGENTGAAYGVAFSPDGALLASVGADFDVRLWSVPGGELRTLLRGHTDAPTRPTFTPDGRTLVTGSGDGTVRLWDVATGASRVLRGHRQQVRAIAVSHDGRFVASGSKDATVRVWDLRTGAGVVLGNHSAEVRDVAFSPDDRYLASASFDQSVRLWEISSRSYMPLRGHRGQVNRVAFRPDGGQLASVAADGMLRLWPGTWTLDAPNDPVALRRWIGTQTTMSETTVPRSGR